MTQFPARLQNSINETNTRQTKLLRALSATRLGRRGTFFGQQAASMRDIGNQIINQFEQIRRFEREKEQKS